jgi:hypothetical protein
MFISIEDIPLIEGNILVILYYLSGFIGGMSSIEENILVILYYLSSLIGGMSSIEGKSITNMFPSIEDTPPIRLLR